MARARRNQKHLAVDSNVLVAYLDKQHPQHRKVIPLTERRVALNPTVIHETYHTIVFKMKWERKDASKTLLEILDDADILFLNQTKDTPRIGLRLAERYAIGGRDALILASFLNASIGELKTFDKQLIRLRKVEHGSHKLNIQVA